jgi:hypothetical protein
MLWKLLYHDDFHLNDTSLMAILNEDKMYIWHISLNTYQREKYRFDTKLAIESIKTLDWKGFKCNYHIV